MTLAQILAVVGAYLIGSVSFARLIARYRIPDQDISTTMFDYSDTDEQWAYTGVSAASVLQRAGPRWGLTVAGLDAAKALLPTLAVRLVWPDDSVYLLVALAVVIGHIWPIWHGFRGGRGQSSILGAMIVINVWAIPFTLVVGMAFGLFVFTSVNFAREGYPLFFPLWFLLRDGLGPEFAFAVGLAVVFFLGMIPDIREDLRIRRNLGVDKEPWRERVRLTLHAFTSGN